MTFAPSQFESPVRGGAGLLSRVVSIVFIVVIGLVVAFIGLIWTLMTALTVADAVHRRHDVQVTATVISLKAPDSSYESSKVTSLDVSYVDPDTQLTFHVRAQPRETTKVISSPGGSRRGGIGTAKRGPYSTQTYRVGQKVTAYIQPGEHLAHLSPPPGPAIPVIMLAAQLFALCLSVLAIAKLRSLWRTRSPSMGFPPAVPPTPTGSALPWPVPRQGRGRTADLVTEPGTGPVTEPALRPAWAPSEEPPWSGGESRPTGFSMPMGYSGSTRDGLSGSRRRR